MPDVWEIEQILGQVPSWTGDEICEFAVVSSWSSEDWRMAETMARERIEDRRRQLADSRRGGLRLRGTRDSPARRRISEAHGAWTIAREQRRAALVREMSEEERDELWRESALSYSFVTGQRESDSVERMAQHLAINGYPKLPDDD